jgi:hypothetical protein
MIAVTWQSAAVGEQLAAGEGGLAPSSKPGP